MLSAVKAKLALLVHTKVGATVLAATLVAGTGTTVALAATHGHLEDIGSALSGHDDGNHLSIEGVLQSYTAATKSTPGSIVVKPDNGDAVTIVITSDTRINGETHDNAASHEATPAKTCAPETKSGTGDASDHSGSSTSGTGEHEGTPTSGSSTTKDVEHEGTPTSGGSSPKTDASTTKGSTTPFNLASALHGRVQVQADKDGKNWVATKVTVQGSGDGNAQGESEAADHECGTPEARSTEAPETHGGTPEPSSTHTPDH